MNSICRTLLPNMNNYFRDNEKLCSIVSVIVGNLVSPNLKSPHRFSIMGRISSFCLSIILNLNVNTTRIWKKDLWDAFFDNSFLWMPHYYFTVATGAFRIITQEHDRIIEVLGIFTFLFFYFLFFRKIFYFCHRIYVSFEGF